MDQKLKSKFFWNGSCNNWGVKGWMLSLSLTQQTLGAAVEAADTGRVWTDYKPKERKTNLFILHLGMNALSKQKNLPFLIQIHIWSFLRENPASWEWKESTGSWSQLPGALWVRRTLWRWRRDPVTARRGTLSGEWTFITKYIKLTPFILIHCNQKV